MKEFFRKDYLVMENNRGEWGSNIGFLMAAVGSAVGLGNIWGFPNKMGRSGGFTFLIIYLLLAVFVGLTIMASELAIGRMTKKSPVLAYKDITKKFNWIGYLALLSPYLIMTFYSVLGGYCLYYVWINLKGLFGTMQNSESFGYMLTNIPLSLGITVLFMIICYIIVAGGVASGIEKFNKVGMPLLFVMLLVIIIKAFTMPKAVEGLKYMFVPGYAVKGGFIEAAPDVVTILATAGGQMFFSLSLAMGAMITYGSYLSKEENLVKNSIIIVIADTCVALMAGLAVIPAAVSNQFAAGLAPAEMTLGGPKLLFVTLQDTFYAMGKMGAIFGIIFYVLVLIAAISSAISLMEAIAAHFLDSAAAKGVEKARKPMVLKVAIAILILAALVGADGLGSNGFSPWNIFGMEAATADWNADWLDFMDMISEGIAMPLGAMLMSLMVGWEKGPELLLDEIHNGESSHWFPGFYRFCVRFVSPIVMAFVLAGQINSFFASSAGYVIAVVLLVIFWIVAATGKKEA